MKNQVKLLEELVQINSGTQNIAGVNAVQQVVKRELDSLGFTCQLLDHPEGAGKSGQLLVATLGSSQGSWINLVTHADTVFEPESGFLQFHLDEAAGTATGPGVIDDKGGIVVALLGIQKFLQRRNSGTSKLSTVPPLPAIRMICTPSEEIGSPGFGSIFQKLSQDAKVILGFEPSLEDGSIIESRRGNRWYEIHVHGREGHAGRDHAQCVNAAHELAFKMTQLHALTDYSRNITVSTGQISGGSKFNIICGHAMAKVDVRFSDFESRDEIDQKIRNILRTTSTQAQATGERPQIQYSIEDDCPPFSKVAESDAYLAEYLKIVSGIESRAVRSVKSGGAADANYLSRPGLIIVDGLGATGGGMHRQDEFIRLQSLESRSMALAQFLEFIAQKLYA